MILSPYRLIPVTANDQLPTLFADVLSEVRLEFEQVRSLIEAGLREAGEAEWSGGTESASWRRAIDIGRAARDVLSSDAERIAEAEMRVAALARLYR